MSLQRLPGGRLKVRYRDGAGVHRAKTFERGEITLARAYEDEVRRAKRLGYLPQLQASSRTIGEVAAEWWASHGRNTAPRTAQLYEQLLRCHVLPTFDARRLGEVTVADVELWLARLDTGPTAKRKALGILSQVFCHAMRAGYTQGNPAQLARKPKLPDAEPINPPTPAQVEGIRKALFDCRRPADAHLISALAYAGLRPQEAWILTWEDVRGQTILVRSQKTGRHRAVKMLAPLVADLADHKSACPPRPNVFVTQGELALTRANWANWRRRVWGAVAPPGMRPYDLRHFYVSMMLRDPEVSRVEAAEQAGHSLQVQDRTYAHLVMESRGRFEDAIRAARAEVFGVVEEVVV
ncbi:MAG: tyrosine-type recombinase/integrase [Thermoleophilaceae bacterium]